MGDWAARFLAGNQPVKLAGAVLGSLAVGAVPFCPRPGVLLMVSARGGLDATGDPEHRQEGASYTGLATACSAAGRYRGGPRLPESRATLKCPAAECSIPEVWDDWSVYRALRREACTAEGSGKVRGDATQPAEEERPTDAHSGGLRHG